MSADTPDWLDRFDVTALASMPAKQRDELMRRIRHDLRTPLNAILGYSEMLREDAQDEGLDDFHRNLGKIHAAAEGLLAMIDGLTGATSVSPAVEGEATDPTSLAGARVLLVEDHPVNQELALAMLEDAGITAVVAGNGREALAVLESEAVDGVLMDIYMPVMDGCEATREIRGRPELTGLPVIAMSAGDEEDRRKALEAGMNDFIAKPLDSRHALARMARLIRASKGPSSRSGSKR